MKFDDDSESDENDNVLIGSHNKHRLESKAAEISAPKTTTFAKGNTGMTFDESPSTSL